MKRIPALFLCLVMVLGLLSGCSREITVDTTGLVNIESSGETVSKTKQSYATVLTADMYYVLPETVTVAMNGEVITEGYTYNPSTGELMISEEAVTGNISISAKAESIPVSVDTQGLCYITANGSAEGLTMQDYTTTLTPDGGYLLPENVSVLVDGTALDSGYTYDPATGGLTISGKFVTGDVEISAKAYAEIVGTWQGSFDFANVLNMLITADDPSASAYLNYHDLPLDVQFEFKEDETASIVFDEACFLAMEEQIKAQTKEGVVRLLESLMKEQGINMSLDDFLALAKVDLDTMLEEEMGDIFTAEQLEEMNSEGCYRIYDGQIYLLDSPDDNPERGDGMDYTLEGNTLTLGTEDISEAFSFMFPLKLDKVQ